MKYSSAFFFLLSACCASLASGGRIEGQRIGGACEYRSIYGRAIITDIRDAAPDANNCRGGVEVVFTFTPDDPSASKHYRFADHPDTEQYLRVGAGMNPPRDWALDNGLAKGTVHRCIRAEVLKGACTPVIFTFPDIDMTDWKKNCFTSHLYKRILTPARIWGQKTFLRWLVLFGCDC